MPMLFLTDVVKLLVPREQSRFIINSLGNINSSEFVWKQYLTNQFLEIFGILSVFIAQPAYIVSSFIIVQC
jgi:hypothetical protein